MNDGELASAKFGKARRIPWTSVRTYCGGICCSASGEDQTVKKSQITAADENHVIAEGFATVEEAAKFLGLSRASVYVLMNDGELASAKFGKARRIPWTSVRTYAAKCLVG
jgi:excisionase family DNA binding protein